MTTNIDRAAEVIYRALSGKYGDFCHHEDTAQALAAENLLMPDLPEPDSTGSITAWMADDPVLTVTAHSILGVSLISE